MAYQGVVNIIRAVAVAVNPTGFFQHGRTWDASLNFDEGDPQIYLYPLTATVDETNHYYETWQVVMGFFYQDAQDSTVAEREALIASADLLQRQFTTTLNAVEGIELGSIRAEPKYRQMAGTYSGILLNFTLGATTNICGSEVVPDIPNVKTFCEKVDECLSIPTENGSYLLKILNGAKSWVLGSGGGGVWGSITGTLSNQTDLQAALDGKVDKVTGKGLSENDFTTILKTAYDDAVTWISTNGSNLLNHLTDTSNPHSTTAVQVGAYTTTQTDSLLAGKQNSLGYVPEDVANKAVTMTGNTSSNTAYLSAKAVYDWVTGLGYLLASTAASTYQTIITAASWGSFINGLTAKTTLADADLITIADSADSNKAKKITIADVRSAIVDPQWLLKNKTRVYTECTAFFTTITSNQDLDGDTRAGVNNVGRIERDTNVYTDAVGVALFGTGFNSAGGARIFCGGFNVGSYAIYTKAHLKIPVLATSTDNFNAGIGLFSVISATSFASSTHGIYVYCANGVNSGNFTLVCVNGGVSTSINTGIAPVANTFYNIEILINAAGTEVRCYINDVEPAVVGYPITSNIPTSTYLFGQVTLEKTAGTNDRTMCVDNYGAWRL